MKSKVFKLDEWQLPQFFSAVRDHRSIILIWIKALQTILSYVEPSREVACGTMTLQIDKMRRLLFESGNKMFSIHFPFNVDFDKDEIMISFGGYCYLDNRKISVLSSIIQEKDFEQLDVLAFADFVYENYVNIESSLWAVLRDLMMVEAGYVRHDVDLDRANGSVHPINHIDIFFTNGSTFKVGLDKAWSKEEFLDLFDRATECYFAAKKS
jgi:hypothetical protein